MPSGRGPGCGPHNGYHPQIDASKAVGLDDSIKVKSGGRSRSRAEHSLWKLLEAGQRRVSVKGVATEEKWPGVASGKPKEEGASGNREWSSDRCCWRDR